MREWDDFRGLVVEVLAPCDYDELQQLKEYERIVTSYAGKPINYDIACETVNKLLDEKEQLKKELESARWYQTVQNEDITKLRALLKEGARLLSFEHETYEAENFIKEVNEVTSLSCPHIIRNLLRTKLKKSEHWASIMSLSTTC